MIDEWKGVEGEGKGGYVEKEKEEEGESDGTAAAKRGREGRKVEQGLLSPRFLLVSVAAKYGIFRSVQFCF